MPSLLFSFLSLFAILARAFLPLASATSTSTPTAVSTSRPSSPSTTQVQAPTATTRSTRMFGVPKARSQYQQPSSPSCASISQDEMDFHMPSAHQPQQQRDDSMNSIRQVHDDSDDENRNARFAKSYQQELESLGRLENAYLQRNKQQSLVVPVATSFAVRGRALGEDGYDDHDDDFIGC